jgi:hypothetical protein
LTENQDIIIDEFTALFYNISSEFTTLKPIHSLRLRFRNFELGIRDEFKSLKYFSYKVDTMGLKVQSQSEKYESMCIMIDALRLMNC